MKIKNFLAIMTMVMSAFFGTLAFASDAEASEDSFEDSFTDQVKENYCNERKKLCLLPPIYLKAAVGALNLGYEVAYGPKISRVFYFKDALANELKVRQVVKSGFGTFAKNYHLFEAFSLDGDGNIIRTGGKVMDEQGNVIGDLKGFEPSTRISNLTASNNGIQTVVGRLLPALFNGAAAAAIATRGGCDNCGNWTVGGGVGIGVGGEGGDSSSAAGASSSADASAQQRTGGHNGKL